MKNALTVYKKMIKEVLRPHGYKARVSVSYKFLDDMVTYLRGKNEEYAMPVEGYEAHQRLEIHYKFDIFIDFLPYCLDSTGTIWYDIVNGGIDLHTILWRLKPEMTQDEMADYYSRLNDVPDEEIGTASLLAACNEIEDLVLPYIHSFADLETYYNEYIHLMTMPYPPLFNHVRPKDDVYRHNPVVYGLSLKLRKYDKALIHVDRMFFVINTNRKNSVSNIEKIRSGDIPKYMLTMQNRNPNYIDSRLKAAEDNIVLCEQKIREWKIIEEALLSRDYGYLDNLVKETEDKNREYLRELFEGKS